MQSPNFFSSILISSVPKLVLSFINIPLAFKFFASSISVKRSPITKEFSKSYSSEKKWVINPVLGFLSGEFSSGNDLSIICSLNTTPSLSNVFNIKLCVGQKSSSGYASVPKPS